MTQIGLQPELAAAATTLRTHQAGAVSRAELGQTVRLGGWVHRRRDLGGLLFVDLRDRAGLVDPPHVGVERAVVRARSAMEQPYRPTL